MACPSFYIKSSILPPPPLKLWKTEKVQLQLHFFSAFTAKCQYFNNDNQDPYYIRATDEPYYFVGGVWHILQVVIYALLTIVFYKLHIKSVIPLNTLLNNILILAMDTGIRQ